MKLALAILFVLACPQGFAFIYFMHDPPVYLKTLLEIFVVTWPVVLGTFAGLWAAAKAKPPHPKISAIIVAVVCNGIFCFFWVAFWIAYLVGNSRI